MMPTPGDDESNLQERIDRVKAARERLAEARTALEDAREKERDAYGELRRSHREGHAESTVTKKGRQHDTAEKRVRLAEDDVEEAEAELEQAEKALLEAMDEYGMGDAADRIREAESEASRQLLDAFGQMLDEAADAWRAVAKARRDYRRLQALRDAVKVELGDEPPRPTGYGGTLMRPGLRFDPDGDQMESICRALVGDDKEAARSIKKGTNALKLVAPALEAAAKAELDEPDPRPGTDAAALRSFLDAYTGVELPKGDDTPEGEDDDDTA